MSQNLIEGLMSHLEIYLLFLTCLKLEMTILHVIVSDCNGRCCVSCNIIHSCICLHILSLIYLSRKITNSMIYGTLRINSVFTRALQLPLSCAESTQFLVLIPISLRSIPILSSHLRLRLPKGLFPPAIGLLNFKIKAQK